VSAQFSYVALYASLGYINAVKFANVTGLLLLLLTPVDVFDYRFNGYYVNDLTAVKPCFRLSTAGGLLQYLARTKRTIKPT